MGPGIPFEQLLAADLQDPEVRAEWVRTAVARAVAIWLIQYRAARGWSLEELARRSGLEREVVEDLEIGEREPSMSLLLGVARALDTPLTLRVERGLPGGNTEIITIGDRADRAA